MRRRPNALTARRFLNPPWGLRVFPILGINVPLILVWCNKLSTDATSYELTGDEPFALPPDDSPVGQGRGELRTTGQPIAQIVGVRPSQRASEIQTRFSIICASETARSSGTWPMTRWLRPLRVHQASDKSPRRSDWVGASAAPLAKMQRRTGAPVGST